MARLAIQTAPHSQPIRLTGAACDLRIEWPDIVLVCSTPTACVEISIPPAEIIALLDAHHLELHAKGDPTTQAVESGRD